ncbi:MAG: UDP-glucose 4-epimerase GalE [Gammaproteobacteria bacterium]|nr:UDP-glucose 4-epimerase GalE [Gammaproteobacteria bacterium]
MRKILVVGGAGFIGSHMVRYLARAGFQVMVLDNLSKGHRDALSDVELIVGDMGDKALLQHLFRQYHFSAVMHFASLIDIAESIQFPDLYYQNNVIATKTLLETMLEHEIKHIIFSSTAAVYGEPKTNLLTENHKLAPINPYGQSKKIAEKLMQMFSQAVGLNYIILRYFNAAGADPDGQLGERHEPETHLIPLVLQVAAGKREHVAIYGNQYPTLDGTCIRDYVHVTDLCHAHLLALEALLQGKKNKIYNLGAGQGHSVLEVIEAVQRIVNRPVPIVQAHARAGDSARLVADTTLVRSELQWQPQYSDLETIIQHTWRFMNKQ